MLLPYRAKNPPEQFPYVTIGLIALNTIIYACTSDGLLEVSKDALTSFAVSHNNMYSEPWRIFTAMFLHANLLHLIGNMLFLWLFGAATEGRLKPVKFLIMYFIAGVCGGILEDLVWGLANPTAPSLGASGAIMGVTGAYLYLFPYSRICVLYWFGWFWRGVWEVQARWVVLIQLSLEIFEAAVYQGGDGVGHLAHIGGAGAGILFVALLRTRRDSEDVSEVQAIQADVKDFTLLSLSDLETLMQRPTEDMEIVMAYLEKASGAYAGGRQENVLQVLNHYGNKLISTVSAERLAYVVLRVPVQMGGMHPVFYLRLGSRLESKYSNDLASQIYRRVYDLAPNSPDTEMALYRLANIMESAYGNRVQATAIYHEMLRLFPHGQMAMQAKEAIQRG